MSSYKVITNDGDSIELWIWQNWDTCHIEIKNDNNDFMAIELDELDLSELIKELNKIKSKINK